MITVFKALLVNWIQKRKKERRRGGEKGDKEVSFVERSKVTPRVHRGAEW